MSFYYGGAKAIGNIFLDDLGDSLPFNAVSLAAVVVSDAFVMLTSANCKLASLCTCGGS